MEMSVEEFANLGDHRFPGLIGFRVTASGPGRLVARLDIRPELLAPNGYLHAATVVGLADTACGYGCRPLLPAGATGFTTVELKANFVGTALSGTLESVAEAVHAGRTTQVWDATVRHVESDRTIAVFRCTQLVLWPKNTDGRS